MNEIERSHARALGCASMIDEAEPIGTHGYTGYQPSGLIYSRNRALTLYIPNEKPSKRDDGRIRDAIVKHHSTLLLNILRLHIRYRC